MQSIQSQSLETAIATLFTGFLVKKFSLDNLYYGFAYTIVLSALAYVSTFRGNNISIPEIGLSSRWLFGLLPLLVGLSYYWFRQQKVEAEEYVRIYIYDTLKLSNFIKYVKMYPSMFRCSHDINVGDKDIVFGYLQGKGTPLEYRDVTSELDDVQIPFEDTNFHVAGYICWHREKREIAGIPEKNNKNAQIDSVSLKYVEIALRKNNQSSNVSDKNSNVKEEVNPRKYVDDFMEHLRERESSDIELQYVKVIKDDKHGGCVNHEITTYKGPRRSFDVKEKLYMDTFFHQERDRLWSVIKTIDQDPDFFINSGQGARINLLLWGPSGAGKSSFVYRIAMCLDRHIVSLDLRNQSKSEIYQIIQRPSLSIAGVHQKIPYKKCVLMFEEFDISILELYQRSRRQQMVEEIWKQYRGPGKEMEREEEKTEEEEKFDKSLLMVDSQFSIRDLLEIFQGPIPMHGMLLMATTNKYDEIRQLCPELFRPGRLTPVHFGYITKDVLQDISKYYFGRKLDYYLPETMTIPTSQIIDLAMESKLQENSFEYFSQHLQKLLG